MPFGGGVQLLQWGRRENTAEIKPEVGRTLEGVVLQWGRRENTAEMVSPGDRVYVVAQLQWGRRENTAEMARITSATTPTELASMGPP